MRTIEFELGETNNYFVREAFNTLRTNILFSGKDVKVIIVTSCMAHEGKTTVSFEMAKSLAESQKKVLLVDADLRKSVTASRYTKERSICGLSQVLSGQAELGQALYASQIPNLHVVFAGPFPPNPTELVGSPAFKEIIDDVRDRYDYVIVDAPPLGMVIDAAIMASVCDGAVIVINQGVIKYRIAQYVKEQLVKSGCRILGVVLNQTQRKRHSIKSGKDAYYSQYSEYYAMDGQEKLPTGQPKPAAQRTVPRPPQQGANPQTGTPAQRPARPAQQTQRSPMPPRNNTPGGTKQ